MARFKGNKLKKKEKRPRGGGFGFNKSKEIKEFEGDVPKHGSPNQSPISRHTMKEEVFIMDNTVKATKQPASFNQLSRISMTHLTNSKLDTEELDESTEELGFFFDSMPSIPVENQSRLKIKPKSNIPAVVSRSPNNNALTNYQKKKSKIIQDDTIYIDSDDDQDDMSSISSSEDVSMLDALAHWGDNAMFQEEPAGHRYHSDAEEDYAILMGTTLNDICDSDQDKSIVLDSDEEQNPNTSFGWDLSEDIHVPENLKHSYRGLVAEERSRIKKQIKQQYKKKRTEKIVESIKKDNNKGATKSGKKNIFDQILHEFIQKDHLKTYHLSNLTFHGRRIVVPKLAKMFKLDISVVNSSKSSVQLVKTKKTCRPEIHKKEQKKKVYTKREDIRLDKFRIRDNENHGKEVASSSTPIASNNVGHRMLAAMGWKEGEAIGNNENGIKEPVKVFMRANRRGLGA
ncbi:hypothetical protein INT46_008447 [Mucor plumbeus]|uniref:G-patch domain-containing protein n=1 Tax=Mucor plumbeus TaxID=97098 RepID=A0A8H7V3Q7_9FUNG|nr:hypothetical protein INT46_008447 [Mucor plumbeus]